MEYYLLKLSYSTTGWKGIVDTVSKGAKAQAFDDRLGPVRALITNLGGSFASFHFYKGDKTKKEICVRDKFVEFGKHDLIAVLAFEDRNAAEAFRIALLQQPGVKHVKLVALMPFEDAIADSVYRAKKAIDDTKYAGPG